MSENVIENLEKSEKEPNIDESIRYLLSLIDAVPERFEIYDVGHEKNPSNNCPTLYDTELEELFNFDCCISICTTHQWMTNYEVCMLIDKIYEFQKKKTELQNNNERVEFRKKYNVKS